MGPSRRRDAHIPNINNVRGDGVRWRPCGHSDPDPVQDVPSGYRGGGLRLYGCGQLEGLRTSSNPGGGNRLAGSRPVEQFYLGRLGRKDGDRPRNRAVYGGAPPAAASGQYLRWLWQRQFPASAERGWIERRAADDPAHAYDGRHRHQLDPAHGGRLVTDETDLRRPTGQPDRAAGSMELRL